MFGDSSSLLLIAASLSGVIVLLTFVLRRPGTITHSELRERLKHLQ